MAAKTGLLPPQPITAQITKGLSLWLDEKRGSRHTRDHARAEVFDHIERFYNPTRRHSTLGYLSLMDFDRQTVVA